ncbi:MAG: DNA/RNA nuclease SfsA [Anaerolineae bacterium]|nr:DNA/RNA nuclease SfsA [Anaerolineae bacterium]
MHLPFPLLQAQFLRRDNRFRATVALDGEAVAAHVPNSGRLGELLLPGQPVWLVWRDRPGRRTPYDLVLVRYAGVLVSVDARLPNRLFAEACLSGCLPEFGGYTRLSSEVRRGDSRLDFLLEDGTRRCWVETKSCTLVENGVALFPDAPTLRGQRHLYELARAATAGDRAAVIFVVQRADAIAFAPHPSADPEFGKWLRAAAQAGVEIRAYRCRVDEKRISLDAPLEIRMPQAG